MPDTIETTLIAAAAAVAGAGITAISAAYSARQKIAELKLAHAHQQRSDYLSNARAYTQLLYVPLSTELSRLSDQYRAFRNKADLEQAKAPPEAEGSFRTACESYLESVRSMFERGASAFLTIDLEERLLAFNSFIDESLHVTDAVSKLIVEYGFDVGLLPFAKHGYSFSRTVTVPARKTPFNPRHAISAGFGLASVQYRATVVLAAPLASRDFETRAQTDLTELKALVKEVTLGAHAKRDH